MNDLLSVDMDWIDGSDETGDLVWNGDGWSLVDSSTASAVHQYEVDSDGCSLPQNDFDRRAFSNVIAFVQRDRAGRFIEAVAA